MTDTKPTIPNSPHDEFYRQALSNIKVAEELFDKFLPKYVRQLVDLSTLKPEKDTFSDTVLGNSAADAIFSVKFANQDGYLTLHSEHQSTSERFMALRLPKYQTLIYEQYCGKKLKNKYLPLVYSMVYYTGKGKYTAPLDFYELFLDPNLARKLATSPHQLIDLHRLDDKDLSSAVWAGAMMMAMKLAKLNNIDPYVTDMKANLKLIAEKNYIYIEMIFRYIINQADTDEINKVVETFQEVVGPKDRESIMSIAERLIKQGEEAGIQQGLQQGFHQGKEEGRIEEKRSTAVNLLKKGMQIKYISEVTGLTDDEIKNLH